MKKYLVVLLILFFASPVLGAIYYVCPDGNGGGSTDGSSWANCMDGFDDLGTPSAGDTYYLRDDDGVYREQLGASTAGSQGSPITYAAASGESPKISSANDVTTSGWADQGSNVWRHAIGATEVRVVLFDGVLGTEDATPDSQNEWTYSNPNLDIYSESDPDNQAYYTLIEAGQRGSPIVVSASDVTIDGIISECGNGAASGGVWISGTGTTRVTIQNSTLRYNAEGIIVYTTDSQNGNHTFNGNTINNNRLYGIGFNAGSDGSGSGTETTISENTVYSNNTFGIFAYTNYAIIEKNLVYSNGNIGSIYGGIHIYSGDLGSETANTGDNNIVRYNVSHSNISGGEDGTGIQADVYCQNNHIYGNIAYNNDGPGIGVYASDNNVVYNNTCYDNCQNSSGELTQKGEIRITEHATEDNDGTIVKNNIAFATQENTYSIYTGSGLTNLSIDSNIWYRSSGDWYYWDGTTSGSVLATWNAYSGVGTDLNSDPLLNSDYALQSNSPAINSGTNLGATYDDGLRHPSSWPSNVYTGDQDRYGKWEIGAYLEKTVTQWDFLHWPH